MTDESYLTTDEVLEYLQVNLKTLYRLIKGGRIPAVKVGRQWRFRKRDIDAWLGAHSTPAARAVTLSPPSSVLVVDDEEGVRHLISSALSMDASRDVADAADGLEALSMLRERAFDLLITDLKMPGMDGLSLIRQARQLRPDLRVVIITGVPSEASAIDAINLGVSGYLPKPFRMPQILDIVARALTA